jgi:hypothetical protein
MGRWYYNKKATVQKTLDLSVFQLKKYGMLEGDRTAKVITWVMKNTGRESHAVVDVHITGEPHAKLRYLVFDEQGHATPYDSDVSLVTTPCHFGAVRYWFICPLSKNGVYCRRRVGTLYLAGRGKYFGCRHCYSLSYESRNEPRLARLGGIGYPDGVEWTYDRSFKAFGKAWKL